MARKTICIEVVVDDDVNQTKKRFDLANKLQDKGSILHQGLRTLGWSGNYAAVGYTVSNPPRSRFVQT